MLSSSANSAHVHARPEQPISQQTISREELTRAYEDLHKESRRRAVVLASAAHELKTPLAVLAGYLELLLSERLGPLTEKQAKVLSAMQSNSVRLQQFVQDFLMYCAFETGKLAINFETNDLNACILEIYNIWLLRFQDRGTALYFPANESLPRFPFDYHKVQRILSNLLENAFLSTPPGGTVWLSAELHRWERRTRQTTKVVFEQRRNSVEEPNSVRITVADTGPGIAPEFQQEIFDDFVSLRRPTDANQGTGLGLPIARRLVQAQQGKIWVESELGTGSKFCILLPLQPSF